MSCDKCGKPSVYHSTLIVNGVSQKTNLCRDCAMKEGVFNQKTSIFDDLFSSFADFTLFDQVENLVCPVCKTSLREFKSTGNLGCQNCYEIFRSEITELIKRIAPASTHKQEKASVKPQKAKKLTKEEQIAKLRAEMKQAVAEERYEDAGKMKKQITKLESGNE